MTNPKSVVDVKIAHLERRLWRTQCALFACTLCSAMLMLAGLTVPAALAASPQDVAPNQPAAPHVSDVIFTRKLVVVDDNEVARVIIGQDPKETFRRSRAAGITIHDKHGNERGGMSTFDDDSVAIALDAPRGVGDPMPDRIGMLVAPDGGAQLLLIDNQTRGVAKLVSFGDSRGGLQLFKWTDDKIHVKTISFDGEHTEVHTRQRQ